MRILMLLILISNIIALILFLVYYILNNKVIKEYERRMKVIRAICNVSMFLISVHKLKETGTKDTLSDILCVIERGHYE